MPGHRRHRPRSDVDEDGMASALAQEAASVRLKMPDEIDALHLPSRDQAQRLADDVSPGEFLLGERSIRL